MSKDDFVRMGREIRESVEKAIDSIPYEEIGRRVSEGVERTGEKIREEWEGFEEKEKKSRVKEPKGRRFSGKSQNRGSDSSRAEESWEGDIRWNSNRKSDGFFRAGKSKEPDADAAVFASKPKGRFAGPFLIFIGLLICCMMGIAGFLLGIMCIFSMMHLYDAGLPILMGILFVIGAAIFLRGNGIRSRLRRFSLYKKCLAGKEYCELSLLGKTAGKSIRYLRRDLKKMISLGMFPQGHLDETENCLILTDRAYEQYQMMVLAKEEQKREEQEESRRREAEEKKKLEEEEQRYSNVDQEKREEIRKIIREGEAYLERFDQIGKRLVGQEMNKKLSRLSLVTGRIFDFITDHPEKTGDIRKFMSYYLPTTEKLLNTYEELDREPVQGENITKAKKEIMDTLDTINYAFENLLDSLYEDTAMDVSTDIAVLETMLAQEGLVEKEETGWKTF